MDSRQPGKKKEETMEPSRPRGTAPIGAAREKQSVSNSPAQHKRRRRDLASARDSVLGKREHGCCRETSRDRSNPVAKRPCPSSTSSTSQLCEGCRGINWEKIDEWMNFKGRVDWRGKPIDCVGTRYRSISPSSTCQLCRQLHAPWIGPFLQKKDPTQWMVNHSIDRIHIFWHLRHIPHVNDFPNARSVLKKHNAPFHIAVVPDVPGWRDEFRAHLAAKGLVMVLPKEHSESELFVPQRISPTFDPKVVRSWLKYCRRHKKLCKPQSPEVEGMRVINCRSENPLVQQHQPGDSYLTLSYVWGPPSNLAITQTPAAIETSRKVRPTGCTSQPMRKPTAGLDGKKLIVKNAASANPYTSRHDPMVSNCKQVLRLPKALPQTIQDAIHVTKALGYDFLWVDKYCIDQEDPDDVQRQCSRMGDIYAGSQLTICALGHDSEYGLPGVGSRSRFWKMRCTTVAQYKFVSTMADPHLSIQRSAWATRVWTYQEGLFSTRCLFFTDEQVYFECNAMNLVETLKSNLNILHTNTRERFRAFHRAGQSVCGNTNGFSHVNVQRNRANHRKIDTIRRCQYHIQEYTKRLMTDKNDVLKAFSGIACFYARSNAKIASLAGLPIPYPIAQLWNKMEREFRDHLSYALAWIHLEQNFDSSTETPPTSRSSFVRKQLPWCPRDNPRPQRRLGFPSWSWAGWFGELEMRQDLPYFWTSHLSSVRIGFQQDGSEEGLAWLEKLGRYDKQFFVRRLLTASRLYFDAHVLDPKKLKFWQNDRGRTSKPTSPHVIRVCLSAGPNSLQELKGQLMRGKMECLVLGIHGKPRQDVYNAIQVADKKSRMAKVRRIDLFESEEPDAIICLIVSTGNGISHRVGILKVEFKDSRRERVLQPWILGAKRSFILE